MSLYDFVLVAGRSNDPFALAMSQYLDKPLCPVAFTEFPDDGGPMSGETKVEIQENIRGRDVCVLWSIGNTNYDLMVLLQIIDAARLSSGTHHISLVCPEFPYARQDKTHERRESLSSRLVARMLQTAGVDDVLTADLHSDQIEGHLHIPMDHLRTRPVWAHYIGQRYRQWMDEYGLAAEGRDLVLGVPDAGRARAVRELSDEVAKGLRMQPEKIKIKLAHHDKHRRWEVVGEVASHGLLGQVENKVVWFTDDLLSSGSTLFGAAKAAKAMGARYVICSVTHAHGFDKPAPAPGLPPETFAKRLHDSAIDELIVTDTHPRFVRRVLEDPLLAAKTTVLSLTPLFGEAILRVRRGDTIKEMMRSTSDYATLYRVIHEAKARPDIR